VFAGVAWAVLLFVPTSASAHAYLITTSPSIGGVVQSSPPTVSLTYDEAITISPGGLRVYDAAGERVDAGVVRHPVPDTITVAIPRRLPDGTYAVAWRVTSADTHVVHGVFSFSVGAAGRTGGIAAKLLARGQIPEGISVGFAVVRFFNLLLLLVCGGGAVALVVVLRDADARIRRLLFRMLVICGGLLALVAVLGLPFEAAEASGSGLRGGFEAGALAAVRHVRFGEVWLVRAWLAVLFALLALSLRIAPARWRLGREVVLVGVGVGLLLTPSAAGHASVGGPLAFIVDAAHVLAAAAWLGGLAFVLGALAISRAGERWPLAIRSVPRFSLLATGSVGVLLVAGIINAYLEVGAWRGLWQSTYGELILTKAALTLPLLALGAFNNRVIVPTLRAGTPSPTVRARFLRAATAELAVLAVIVGVTAVLIDEPPAKNEVAQTTSITATHTIGPFKATAEVVPGVVGTNTINISVTSTSHKPPTIGEADLAADPPPNSNVATLNLNVIQLSATRFRVSGATLTLAGTWQLEITVRTGLTEWLARIPIQIRAASSP
jgi:copper transport protein